MSNRATNLVMIWLAHDRNLNKYWRHKTDNTGFWLAKELEKSIANHPLKDSPSLYCDMLDNMLRQVDWLEVARDFMEE